MNAFFNTCLAALLGLAGSACARAAEKVMDERELLEYPDELRQAYASEPFLLLRASAMEKFMPDELPADAEERIGAPVHIYCARNEAESVQVLIVPTGPGLKEVRARVEWDDEAAAPPFELFQVGRVNVPNPSVTGFRKPGLWPDPLYPHEAPFKINAGEQESLWLTVRPGADTAPGLRTGRLTVDADGAGASLPLKVMIARTALPTIPRLQTFLVVYHGIPFYHDRWPEAAGVLTNILEKNRYCYPGTAFPFEPEKLDAEETDWSVFDASFERALSVGQTAIQWPQHIFSKSPDEETGARRYRKLRDHLAEKGWLDYTFIYDFDEPQPGSFAELAEYCRKLQAAAPGVRILLTQNYSPEFENLNMIWCPANTWLDDAPKMRAIRDRVDAGDGTFWTYNCSNTNTTFHPDSWRIDWYGAGHRALGAMLWKYGATGYLYWNASYWCDYNNNTQKNMYENPDVYPHADTIPCNGDGFLLYPDPEGRRMPVPSIRLELNRDGFEDYELFALYRDLTGDDLGDAVNYLLPVSDNYCKDPRAYEELHDRVLEYLDANL